MFVANKIKLRNKLLSLLLNSIGVVILYLLVVVLYTSYVSFHGTSNNGGNVIESMSVNLTIQEDGDVRIEEVWHTNNRNGTEYYKDMGDLEIDDLTVEMNGQLMDEVDTWDIDGSYYAKSMKYGINKTLNDDNEPTSEINWGLTEMGKVQYKISYTIKKLIDGYDDADLLFYKVVPDGMGTPILNFEAVIKSDVYAISPKDHRVWGFGYDGYTVFDEGANSIYLKASDSLMRGRYVTVLLKMPKGKHDSRKIGGSSDDAIKTAFEGSDYTWLGSDDRSELVVNDEVDIATIKKIDATYMDIHKFKDRVIYNAMWVILFVWEVLRSLPILYVIPAVLYIYGMVSSVYWYLIGIHIAKLLKKYKNKVYSKYVPTLSQLSKEYDGSYYRDFGSLNWMDELAIIKGLRYTDSDFSLDVIRAMLLQLTKDRNITLIKGEEDLAYRLDTPPTSEFTLELYNLLKVKADKLNIVKLADIEMIFKDGDKTFEFKDLLVNKSYKKLNDVGVLTKGGDTDTNDVEDDLLGYSYNRGAYKLRDNWVKFYNYLKDFTIINERGVSDLQLWDDILIYATVLGIAEDVERELLLKVPEYKEVSIYQVNSSDGRKYNSIKSIGMRSVTRYNQLLERGIDLRSASRSATNTMTTRNRSKRSSSSSRGGGGRSSRGGGRGARGGRGGGSR